MRAASQQPRHFHMHFHMHVNSHVISRRGSSAGCHARPDRHCDVGSRRRATGVTTTATTDDGRDEDGDDENDEHESVAETRCDERTKGKPHVPDPSEPPPSCESLGPPKGTRASLTNFPNRARQYHTMT